MANKNPFELRADIVALAKEYLDQVTALNIDTANKMLEANQITAEQLKDMYKMYTIDDLLEKTKEIYDFVSKKD